MKALIWIGCIIFATILNALIGYATGIKAGYLVFYIAVYFVAKKLCAKWDEHRKTKETEKSAPSSVNSPVVKSAVNTTDEICYCRKCGEKLLNDSQFCRMCNTKVVKDYLKDQKLK